MTPAIVLLSAPEGGARQAPADQAFIEARVVQSVEDGAWLVSAGSRTMMVRADRPLEPGQRVWVAVPRGTGGQPAGAPDSRAPGPQPPPAPADALPRLLAALAALAPAFPPEGAPGGATRVLEALDARPQPATVPEQAVAAIRALLRPAASPQLPAATADVLRRAVEDTGSLFEARTARLLAASPAGPPRLPASDLRTLVGSVLARLITEGPAPAGASGAGALSSAVAARPAEALRSALVEAGAAPLAAQVETVARVEARGIWRVEVPLQFGDGRVHLECEFEPDRDAAGRRGNGRPAGHLRVLVTPDGASPLEARFAWRGSDSLAVDVYVDTEARTAALAPGLGALADRLREAGFANPRIDVWTNPARLACWTARRHAPPPAGTALNAHA